MRSRKWTLPRGDLWEGRSDGQEFPPGQEAPVLSFLHLPLCPGPVASKVSISIKARWYQAKQPLAQDPRSCPSAQVLTLSIRTQQTPEVVVVRNGEKGRCEDPGGSGSQKPSETSQSRGNPGKGLHRASVTTISP